MKNVIAAIALAGLCALASAHNNVVTCSSVGLSVTQNPTVGPNYGCFAYRDGFDMAPGALTSALSVFGTDGPYSCGRGCSGVNSTIYPLPPILYWALPPLDQYGNEDFTEPLQPQAQALDASGNAVVFTSSNSNEAWTTTQVPACDAAHQAGDDMCYFVLSVTGAQCSGRSCKIQDGSYTFVTHRQSY